MARIRGLKVLCAGDGSGVRVRAGVSSSGYGGSEGSSSRVNPIAAGVGAPRCLFLTLGTDERHVCICVVLHNVRCALHSTNLQIVSSFIQRRATEYRAFSLIIARIVFVARDLYTIPSTENCLGAVSVFWRFP